MAVDLEPGLVADRDVVEVLVRGVETARARGVDYRAAALRLDAEQLPATLIASRLRLPVEQVRGWITARDADGPEEQTIEDEADAPLEARKAVVARILKTGVRAGDREIEQRAAALILVDSGATIRAAADRVEASYGDVRDWVAQQHAARPRPAREQR